MNTGDTPRRLTKEQIKERAKERAKIKLATTLDGIVAQKLTPSPTIQSEQVPGPEPKWQPKEIIAPLDPKTSAQKRKAAHHEKIMRAHKQETESPMTLSM
jgi:hypothetical protein